MDDKDLTVYSNVGSSGAIFKSSDNVDDEK